MNPLERKPVGGNVRESGAIVSSIIWATNPSLFVHIIWTTNPSLSVHNLVDKQNDFVCQELSGQPKRI